MTSSPAKINEPQHKYTAFRCPEDLLALVKIKARQNRRSLSNYIVTLIAKDVEGMTLPETPSKQIKRAK